VVTLYIVQTLADNIPVTENADSSIITSKFPEIDGDLSKLPQFVSVVNRQIADVEDSQERSKQRRKLRSAKFLTVQDFLNTRTQTVHPRRKKRHHPNIETTVEPEVQILKNGLNKIEREYFTEINVDETKDDEKLEEKFQKIHSIIDSMKNDIKTLKRQKLSASGEIGTQESITTSTDAVLTASSGAVLTTSTDAAGSDQAT
jgi:hypothetical protein